jgi:hypothetical protein
MTTFVRGFRMHSTRAGARNRRLEFREIADAALGPENDIRKTVRRLEGSMTPIEGVEFGNVSVWPQESSAKLSRGSPCANLPKGISSSGKSRERTICVGVACVLMTSPKLEC